MISFAVILLLFGDKVTKNFAMKWQSYRKKEENP
jgi:hypothetical protein